MRTTATITAAALTLPLTLAAAAGAAATAPAASAAAYTCHYISAGPYPDPLYAGHYSGDTAAPAAGTFSDAALEAQCLLAVFGYPPGPIDGVYGPDTRTAVKKFQQWADTFEHAGLPVDGVLGPATWPLLRKDSNN